MILELKFPETDDLPDFFQGLSTAGTSFFTAHFGYLVKICIIGTDLLYLLPDRVHEYDDVFSKLFFDFFKSFVDLFYTNIKQSTISFQLSFTRTT